jgi:hypothetical protein
MMAAAWLTTIARAFGFDSSRVDFASPLRREECVRRLRGVVDGPWTIVRTHPLMGRVEETSFELRKRINGRNSFQTIARGIFEEESRQTVLRCQFGVRPSVGVFLTAWLAVVVLLGIALVPSAITGLMHGPRPISPDTWMNALGPPLMFCFGIAIVVLGRFFARNEEDYVVRFLVETLKARQLPPRDDPRG